MTRAELAQKIDKPVSYVDRLFQYGGVITFREACKIARAVGMVFYPSFAPSTEEMLESIRATMQKDAKRPLSAAAGG